MCKPWEVELTIVDSGQKAIDTVGSKAFDLILMDIQMPGMDGIETLQRMKAQHEILPPIHAFTAHGGHEEQDKYLQLGFNGVLTKPLTPAQLEQFLKAQAHEQQNRR
jgi:two-component system sensor histidine kinase BarA